MPKPLTYKLKDTVVVAGNSSLHVILLGMGKVSISKSKVQADKIMEEFWSGIRSLGINKKLKSSELRVINAYL